MKTCSEPYCAKPASKGYARCAMHRQRRQMLRNRRKERDAIKEEAKTHKPGTFDISTLGAVGWKPE